MKYLGKITDNKDLVTKEYVDSAPYAGSPSNSGNADKTNGILSGAVDSTSTSTVFTATIPGLESLYDGVAVLLRNGVVTSASGFTININGLGAKPVYSNLATGNSITPTNPTRDTTIFNINYTMLLIYDADLVSGGAWICYRGYDANTNTIGYQLRGNSSTRPAADKGYRYRLWLTSLNGQSWVPINTSTSTDATTSRSLNTRVIDPFGEIVYYSYNGTTNAAANLTATAIWQQYTLTIGYSYVKTLTAWDPVYLKCLPQTSGGAVMKDIVQALPTSNDGYIYIYLGIAYSTTAIELRFWHPVYYHDGTGVKLWSGKAIPSKTSELTNDSGYLTSADIPEGASAYTGTISAVGTSASSGSSNGFARGDHVHNITGTTITTALGYTPYNSTNPDGYTSNTGTVTGVKINGTTKSPTSGIVDIGTVLTSYTETDPVFSASAASGITSSDITNWRNKQDTLVSGTNIKTVNSQSLLGSGDITISGGGSQNTWYGTSDTSATTQTKVVTTTSGDFELQAGNIVIVKFANAQTYDGSYMLNVDGTGAISVMSRGTTASVQYCYLAGETVAHVYDGTNFIAIDEGIASTTYYGATKLSSSTSSTSTILAATPYAVKQAYDYAVNAYNLADDASTVAYAALPAASVADYVIEDGISGSWRYRKWNSGKIEAWFEGTFSCAASTTARGALYYSTWTLSIPSAIGFSGTPNTLIGNTGDSTTVIAVNGSATSATAMSGKVWRYASSSSALIISSKIYAWEN